MDNMNPVGYGMNFPHFQPLNFRNYQNYLPTAYDNSLSMQESLLQVLNFCNEIGLLNQHMSDNWNMLLGWIKTNGIDDAVSAQLNAWVVDGTMAKVLNKTSLKDINKKLDDLLADYPVQLQATKDFVNNTVTAFKNDVNNKLNNQNNVVNAFKNDVDNNLNGQNIKIQQNYESLMQQLSSISNGVRGVYPNLSALTAAKPDGDTGTYVTTDNGHWFFWNGNAWTDGGIYQSVGIADGIITAANLKQNAVNYSKTNFLVNDTDKNLFDGVYGVGTVQGPLTDGNFGYVENPDGRTAIIPIEPNTMYSIRRQVPSRFNIATAKSKLDVGAEFDGSFAKNNSDNGTTETPVEMSFTSGPNDHYLYINMSSDTTEPFLRVVTGELPVDENYMYDVRPNRNVDLLPKSEFESAIVVPEKTSFLTPAADNNLFDGKYTAGITVSGNEGDGFVIASNSLGKTAVITVEPNTTYSIGREVPSRLNWGLATKNLGVGDKLDGSIAQNQSGSGTTTSPDIVNFTTRANDRILYVNMSIDGSEPFLKIVKGGLKSVGEHVYGDDKFSFTSNIELPTSENDKVIRPMHVSYNGINLMRIYIPSKKTSRYVRYDYTYFDSDDINMHQWRVLKTYVVDENFEIVYDFDAQTEWEGAIIETGASDYMGGTHGDERNTALMVQLDGFEHELGSEAFEADVWDKVMVVNHSTLNRPDHTDQDLLSRVKISTWTHETYTVENRYTCLEAFQIAESKLTLMSCRYAIVTNARRDYTWNNVPISAAGVGELANSTKDAHFIEMWGADVYMSAYCEADYEKYPNRKQEIANFSSDAQPRAKIYFNVTGQYDLAKDEVLHCKSIYQIRV